MMTVIAIDRASKAKRFSANSASDFNWKAYSKVIILSYTEEFYGERLKDISQDEINGFYTGVESYILRDNNGRNIKVEAMKAFAELEMDLPQASYIGFLNGFGVAYNKFCGNW